jgi:hypothetical protein
MYLGDIPFLIKERKKREKENIADIHSLSFDFEIALCQKDLVGHEFELIIYPHLFIISL